LEKQWKAEMKWQNFDVQLLQMNVPVTSLCQLKHLLSKFSAQKKKDKCCKSYKDGKQCKRCPKR